MGGHVSPLAVQADTSKYTQENVFGSAIVSSHYHHHDHFPLRCFFPSLRYYDREIFSTALRYSVNVLGYIYIGMLKLLLSAFWATIVFVHCRHDPFPPASFSSLSFSPTSPLLISPPYAFSVSVFATSAVSMLELHLNASFHISNTPSCVERRNAFERPLLVRSSQGYYYVVAGQRT